jgi:hypothetical protein
MSIQVINSKHLSLYRGTGTDQVCGRLCNSFLPYSKKTLNVLSRNHHVTELLIRDCHLNNLHSSTRATLHAIRTYCCSINGKNIIKMLINNYNVF